MKYLVMLALCVLGSALSKPCNAQEYIPMVEEGKYWFYFLQNDPEGCNGQCPRVMLTFLGDSIVNGLKYKKLRQFDVLSTSWTADIIEYTDSDSTLALYREDLDERKVYFLNNNIGEEQLFLDFSQEVGERVSSLVYDAFGEANPSETSLGVIDTIGFSFEWGIDRFSLLTKACLYFASFKTIGSILISEGFGVSEIGIVPFLYRTYDFDYYCDSFSPCEVIVSVKSTIGLPKALEFYPNPTNGELYFLNSEDIKSLRLWSNIGLVNEFDLQSGSISINELAKGIYFIEVVYKDGQRVLDKLIKL